VADDAEFTVHPAQIAELALRNRPPTIFWAQENGGSRRSHGPWANFGELYRRVASHVHKFLQGANPATFRSSSRPPPRSPPRSSWPHPLERARVPQRRSLCLPAPEVGGLAGGLGLAGHGPILSHPAPGRGGRAHVAIVTCICVRVTALTRVYSTPLRPVLYLFRALSFWGSRLRYGGRWKKEPRPRDGKLGADARASVVPFCE
jgi:hypothetical protein